MKFSPRRFISPFVSIVAVVIGVYYSVPWLAALGTGGLAVWIGATWFTEGRSRKGPHMSELGPEGRRLYRPVKAIRDEIQTLANSGARPNVKTVAKSALEDADKMLACTAQLLIRRREIAALIKSHKAAEADIARIEKRLAGAASESEQDARKQALEFRRDEVSRLGEAEKALVQIDSRIAQAEAALAQLKSLLTAGSVSMEAVEAQADQLGGLTNRLESLNRTFEEAEETFRQHS